MDSQNQGGGSVKNENYYSVYGWMVNDLHLEGTEKDVFAFLYGFEEGFEGSIQYIADSIGAKKRMTRYAIDSLAERKLIIKENRKGKTSRYTVAKIATHRGKNCHTTEAKIATNNNIHKSNYKKGTFTDFNQRVYNFSELEKLIRSN